MVFTDGCIMKSVEPKYGKSEAVMMKGFSIITMLLLHLYCKPGTDFIGTKTFVWLNDNTPLISWGGYCANICVDIFSLSAGFAQMLIFEKCSVKKEFFKKSLMRIWNLLLVFWTVVLLFSLLTYVSGRFTVFPGSTGNLIKNLLFIQYDNGAWWYVHSYVFAVALSVFILPFVKRINTWVGVFSCLMLSAFYYFADHFGAIRLPAAGTVSFFFVNEANNLVHMMIPFILGAVICHGRIIERIYAIWHRFVQDKYNNLTLIMLSVIAFTLINIFRLSPFRGWYALFFFMTFILYRKSRTSEKILTFLGKHSTNIWLTHMFFLNSTFDNMVDKIEIEGS